MHLATVISIQLKKQWIDQDVQSTACLISKTYFQKRSKHQLTLCQLKDTLTAEKRAFSFYLKWNVTFSLWVPSITIFLQLSPSLFAPGSARYTGWLQHSWCEILQPHGKTSIIWEWKSLGELYMTFLYNTRELHGKTYSNFTCKKV